MFTTRRMQNKTSCLHFPAATLHCAHAAAKDNFIAFLSYELNGCRFRAGPIVFERLAPPPPSLQQAFC